MSAYLIYSQLSGSKIKLPGHVLKKLDGLIEKCECESQHLELRKQGHEIYHPRASDLSKIREILTAEGLL